MNPLLPKHNFLKSSQFLVIPVVYVFTSKDKILDLAVTAFCRSDWSTRQFFDNALLEILSKNWLHGNYGIQGQWCTYYALKRPLVFIVSSYQIL